MNQIAKKYYLHSPIIEVETFSSDIFRFVLEAPEIARSCRPGQFVNARVTDENYPLLRRPLSIHDTDGKSLIEIVFRIVGEGTRILAGRREGQRLDIIGPLGTPFTIDPERRALIVGGGVGIPPVHNLCREMRRRKISHVAMVGVRSRDEIGLAGKLPEMAEKFYVATDDGSMGHKGFVTDLLREHVRDGDTIYACGPLPLLDAVISISEDRNIPAQVAFEQQMACAFGACIGCSIETNDGYQRVCTEGPVFDSRLFFGIAL